VIDDGTLAPVASLPAKWSCGVLGGSADKPGVIGWSSKSQGVKGWSTKSDGVLGESHKGTGVAGYSSASTGVYGLSGAAPAVGSEVGFSGGMGGVVGASREVAGVLGVSERFPGVYAVNHGAFGRPALEAISEVGVAASCQSLATGMQPGLGVFGIANYYGIYGSSSAGGIGVWGTSGGEGPPVPNVNDTAGVYGSSEKSPGVVGTSQAQIGVYGFSTDYPGVQGVSTNHAGVYGQSTNDFAGYFAGDVFVAGTLSAGAKNAVVAFPDGSKRVLHCMESPEHWFEDFGMGRLKNGRATVKLDADFAKVIKRGDYHVFLTPKGDCGGLYVRRQGGASFEVRELQGGRSSVAFSFRIVGRRKGITAHKRFAKIVVRVPRPPRATGGRKQAASSSALRALLDRLKRRDGTSKPARTRRQPKKGA
jgi:hypothetical protein